MEFISEDGYEVKLGMEEEYQKWVVDTADDLRRALPDGVEYIGTYVMTWGNDTDRGSWRDLYKLDSYAALDRMAAAAKDPDNDFGKLVRATARFIDMKRSPERWTHNLLKSVADATVINTAADETRELVAVGPGKNSNGHGGRGKKRQKAGAR
jgi:hypothetical protein